MANQDLGNLRRTKKVDTLVGALTSGTTTDISTTVVPCSAPVSAIGFRLYPTTNAIRFAVDEDPVAAGTVNAATIGAVAKAGAWESRLLGQQVGDTARTVRLLGTTATTVDLEWF